MKSTKILYGVVTVDRPIATKLTAAVATLPCGMQKSYFGCLKQLGSAFVDSEIIIKHNKHDWQLLFLKKSYVLHLIIFITI